MTRRPGPASRIAVSVALMAAVVWWVGPADLWGSLRRVSLGGFVAVVLVHTGDRLLMAFKWQRLLQVRAPGLTAGEAVRAYYVSSFAGFFLPMTVGADLVRVSALHGGAVESRPLIASIAMERTVGAVSQTLYCALSVVLLVVLQLGTRVPVAWLATAVIGMIVLAAVGLPLSFWLARGVDARLATSAGVAGKLAGLAREYASWQDHPQAIRQFFLLTLIEGLFPILSYLAAARALGVPASLVEMTAVVPLVYLISRMPIGVGGIGAEQTSFAGSAALLLGMAADDAAAISFLVSPLALLVALLPGAVAYVLMHRR